MTQTSIQPTSPEARAVERCTWRECSKAVEFWLYSAYLYAPGKPMESFPLVAHYPAPMWMVCADHVGPACATDKRVIGPQPTVWVVALPPTKEPQT
jgi:hypothetical protein